MMTESDNVFEVLHSDRLKGVYILASMVTNHWKIGMSSAGAVSRARHVIGGAPFRTEIAFVVPCPMRARFVERDLHDAAAAWHSGGEWFEVPPTDHEPFVNRLDTVFAKHGVNDVVLGWGSVLLEQAFHLEPTQLEGHKPWATGALRSRLALGARHGSGVHRLPDYEDGRLRARGEPVPRRAKPRPVVVYERAPVARPGKVKECDLDYSDIDERDEIDGDEQYCLVWCDTHEEYEWHWIDR